MTKTVRILAITLLITLIQAPAFPWSFFGRTPTPAPTPIPEIKPIFFTLMIDPTGDARDAGRAIGDTFEQAISLECAHELKRMLETNIPGLRVIVARMSGEPIDALQNASFANRLKVDLYVTLSFFEQKEKTPQLFFYYSLYNPGTDFWEKKQDELSLVPYNQAYQQSIKKSDAVVKRFSESCSAQSTTCKTPLGIPFKPLLGINAPAFGIEIGVQKKEQWREVVPLLITGFETVITPKSS